MSTCALEAGAISGHPHKTRHPFVAPGCQLLTDTSMLEQHKRLDFKGALTELNDTGDPSSLNLNNSLDVVFLFDVLVPNGNALSCFEFKLELRNTLEGHRLTAGPGSRVSESPLPIPGALGPLQRRRGLQAALRASPRLAKFPGAALDGTQ
ncbi:unnamed protein product [Rangifer tarandus platyrhynchus]|uniref:Uncharacterized protein n=1 Tax=Rangifer tarandus platyrhynchus TaxID=3082113 RepID=A0AC59YKZ5_RANTA